MLCLTPYLMFVPCLMGRFAGCLARHFVRCFVGRGFSRNIQIVENIGLQSLCENCKIDTPAAKAPLYLGPQMSRLKQIVLVGRGFSRDIQAQQQRGFSP